MSPYDTDSTREGPAPQPPDDLGPSNPEGRPRRSRAARTAAGLALVLGTGTGAATVTLVATSSGGALAASAKPATGTSAGTSKSSAAKAPATSPAPVGRGRFGRVFGGPGGAGGPAGPFGYAPGSGGTGAGVFGPSATMGGVVHASYTLKGPSGSYETIDTQVGTAQAVTASSITVKSADGFVQVYQVSPDTVVEAGPAGITAVAVGDNVSVEGLVSGSSVDARRVTDLTQVAANRKSWAPGGPPGPSGTSAGGTSAGTNASYRTSDGPGTAA